MHRVMLCAALFACGGQNKQIAEEMQSFKCRERSAAYNAVKTISADEIGVLMDCAAGGPRIKRWKTLKNGQHLEDTRGMTPGEFDKTWTEIDGIGWPYLHDCPNGTLLKSDPVYTFDIKDDTNKASFACQTHEVPYPYFDITNALDLAANQGRTQLGGPTPDEPKP